MPRNGFTLLEIIISMLLLSIVVFGTAGLFSKVNEYFFRLTLKQKAIFVLNGEMAKEYAYSANQNDVNKPKNISDFTSFLKNENECSRYEITGDIFYVWIDQERLIYGKITITKSSDEIYDIMTIDYPFQADKVNYFNDVKLYNTDTIVLKTILPK